MDGPARWTSITTTGVSIIADMPKPSRHQREAAAGGGAHGAHARVSGADRHIDHADFVLYLPDHDAGLARVGRHPVQHAGRRTHGIGAIKLHACRRASHGQGHVSGQHGVAIVRHGQRAGERPEVCGGIVVGSAGHARRFRPRRRRPFS